MVDLESHCRLLLSSYLRAVGKELIELKQGESSAAALDRAPFALLSHGAEADPVLNYGNKKALELWEADWEAFTSMPSRLTAEPMLREDRDRLLMEVREQGFSNGYVGVRISLSGRRFRIEETVIWNVVDEEGRFAGQAAMIPRWTELFS
ncbi:MEKHLA domain-containing protein [Cohnella faecalis]|uniref:MEKHLA domain-containing protein n=1 Tax=Cohnella faecalis TaxID=2315694 RepID=UPI001F2F3018|nr:MEKHLA domain-containing protein [Cohnella faecalis]